MGALFGAAHGHAGNGRPIQEIRILAVSMLLALVVGGVRLSRLRTQKIELRIEPGRVLLDGKAVENALEQLDLPQELVTQMKDAFQLALQRVESPSWSGPR